MSAICESLAFVEEPSSESRPTSICLAGSYSQLWRSLLWPREPAFVTALRQDPPPLEAILVIFGRRALIFFLFESSWKKMKNDATFVRMRSGDHLGDAKMSKKGTSLRRI